MEKYLENIKKLDLSKISEEMDKLVCEVLGDDLWAEDVDPIQACKIVKDLIKKMI